MPSTQLLEFLRKEMFLVDFTDGDDDGDVHNVVNLSSGSARLVWATTAMEAERTFAHEAAIHDTSFLWYVIDPSEMGFAHQFYKRLDKDGAEVLDAAGQPIYDNETMSIGEHHNQIRAYFASAGDDGSLASEFLMAKVTIQVFCKEWEHEHGQSPDMHQIPAELLQGLPTDLLLLILGDFAMIYAHPMATIPVLNPPAPGVRMSHLH